MSCFPCFSSMRSKKSMKANHASPAKSPSGVQSPAPSTPNRETKNENPAAGPTPAASSPSVDTKKISAQSFTFRELAMATKNFKQESLLGESGFGRVYKGTIKASGQLVAVKQLDRNGMNENRDFLGSVQSLSNLKHTNLVNLVGYCADGDQRLLVYEFLAGGTLKERLHGENGGGKGPLGWTARMKIAYGAAQALEYLHTTPDPPIVYRDLKASSILLDEDCAPKLSDIGVEKLDGTSSEKLMAQSMMGMYGYSAPEYTRSNQLTTKSDVYSFGVVLLQLITGRKAVDTTKPNDEQNLISWAQPLFRDPKKYPEMADSQLKKQFPERDLNQAFAMASMCLQEEAGARPFMSDVVTALGFLSVEAIIPPILAAQDNIPSEDNNSKRDSSSDSSSTNEEDEKSVASSRPKTEKSHSRSPSSSSSSSHNRDSRKLAPAASAYLHCLSSQQSMNRSRSSKSDDESSPYGSDDDEAALVIDHPKEFTSFRYENSAKWAQYGSIDDGHDHSIRSHDTSD